MESSRLGRWRFSPSWVWPERSVRARRAASCSAAGASSLAVAPLRRGVGAPDRKPDVGVAYGLKRLRAACRVFVCATWPIGSVSHCGREVRSVQPILRTLRDVNSAIVAVDPAVLLTAVLPTLLANAYSLPIAARCLHPTLSCLNCDFGVGLFSLSSIHPPYPSLRPSYVLPVLVVLLAFFLVFLPFVCCDSGVLFAVHLLVLVLIRNGSKNQSLAPKKN